MDKKERYELSLQQIKAITAGEPSKVANLANTVAVLKQNLGYFWTGFYLVEGDELVLGPFQGTPACVRIARGKGVCGACWQRAQSIVVDDVHEFPGHIACDANSKSEIVVPVFDRNGSVCMLLDIDHDDYRAFDETDRHYLEQLARYLTSLL